MLINIPELYVVAQNSIKIILQSVEQNVTHFSWLSSNFLKRFNFLPIKKNLRLSPVEVSSFQLLGRVDKIDSNSKNMNFDLYP